MEIKLKIREILREKGDRDNLTEIGRKFLTMMEIKYKFKMA